MLLLYIWLLYYLKKLKPYFCCDIIQWDAGIFGLNWRVGSVSGFAQYFCGEALKYVL